MLLSKKAQSIIEYTTVIVLVVAGLILMRPYVIRAVNAHMKSWQDNVKDSMKETLHEAPPPAPPECGDGACTIPETIASCCADCGSGCGDGTCCAATEDNTSCPQDCSVCGDSQCTGGETAASCCSDCSTCGDGCCCVNTASGPTCSTTGTPINDDVGCTADCPQVPICDNDGTCESGETIWNCGGDCCPPLCGNGTCDYTGQCWEYTSCPCDCDRCGDSSCNCGENVCGCRADCGVGGCNRSPWECPNSNCFGMCSTNQCCVYYSAVGQVGCYCLSGGRYLWTSAYNINNCPGNCVRVPVRGYGCCGTSNSGRYSCESVVSLGNDLTDLATGCNSLTVFDCGITPPPNGYCETNPSVPPCRCSSLNSDICSSTPGCSIDLSAPPCRPNCGNSNCYSCHDPNAPSMCQGCWNITNQGYCEAMCTGDCSIQANHTCVWFGQTCTGNIDCSGFGSDKTQCDWYTCCRWHSLP